MWLLDLFIRAADLLCHKDALLIHVEVAISLQRFLSAESFLDCWHPTYMDSKVIPCWVQDFILAFIELLEVFNLPVFLALGCPLDWPPKTIPRYCFRVLSACSTPCWVSPATLLSVHSVPSSRFSVKTLTSISSSFDLWRTPLVNVCQLDFVLLVKIHRAWWSS